MDDGTLEIKPVADLLVRKLYNRPDFTPAVREELPLVAGSLWAAQVHDSATEHRLRIPKEVSEAEALLWLFALWELCLLINAIHGDGTAEGLMYEIEEIFREDTR